MAYAGRHNLGVTFNTSCSASPAAKLVGLEQSNSSSA